MIASALPDPIHDCNHEEVDTKIMVHIRHTLEQGAETVLIQAVDTDVVVIFVGMFFHLVTIQPSSDFWIACSMGEKLQAVSLQQHL